MANPAPSIKYYEEYFFDNIILMAPSVRGISYLFSIILELKSPISHKDLIDYLEANHNLMIFGDVDSRKVVRGLFNEFGSDLENIV